MKHVKTFGEFITESLSYDKFVGSKLKVGEKALKSIVNKYAQEAQRFIKELASELEEDELEEFIKDPSSFQESAGMGSPDWKDTLTLVFLKDALKGANPDTLSKVKVKPNPKILKEIQNLLQGELENVQRYWIGDEKEFKEYTEDGDLYDFLANAFYDGQYGESEDLIEDMKVVINELKLK